MSAPNPVLLNTLSGIEQEFVERPMLITLRDLFAAFALCGYSHDPHNWKAEEIAGMCYRDADAMLAQRAKGETK